MHFIWSIGIISQDLCSVIKNLTYFSKNIGLEFLKLILKKTNKEKKNPYIMSFLDLFFVFGFRRVFYDFIFFNTVYKAKKNH